MFVAAPNWCKWKLLSKQIAAVQSTLEYILTHILMLCHPSNQIQSAAVRSNQEKNQWLIVLITYHGAGINSLGAIFLALQ
jgi:hypothetical protein